MSGDRSARGGLAALGLSAAAAALAVLAVRDAAAARGAGGLAALHAGVALLLAAAAGLTWRRVERARRAAVDRLALQARALEGVGEAVIMLDDADRVLSWNAAAVRMYGIPAAEAVGRGLSAELVDWRPELPLTQDEVRHRVEQGGEALRFEAHQRSRAGRAVHAEVLATPVTDPAGRRQVVIVMRDVGAERAVARALRASEERLSLALAGSGAEVWEWDWGASRLRMGARWAARRALPEELAGTPEQILSRLVHPADLPQALATAAGAGAGGDVALEFRAVYPDGSVRWEQIRGRVAERTPDGAPARLIGTVRDVTDARDLHARVERTERLASLGTLAAGIAHEVNNPIAYVAANLNFLREQLGGDAGAGGVPAARAGELRQAVDEALSGARRVREIVAGLRQFARPPERGPRPVDVRGELEAAVGMTRHELEHRARLVLDVPPALPPVVAGATELGQVFVNLLVNAAHAIPEGRAAEHEVRVSAVVEGGRVLVTVSDTGVGIPPDVLPHVFDPFFTTKPVGGGTGLGLSICHGIVNAAGGTIEVESAPGRGTTFRVLLPAAAPGAADVAPSSPAPAARRARVLVVDDEPLVGRALGRILSGEHDVEVTTSAAEALERIAAGERFDLVLCDLMMPDMTGMELEARVAQAVPAMVGHLVFMTGGAFTPAARAFLDGGRPHLEKPIETAVLRELVARRLRELSAAG